MRTLTPADRATLLAAAARLIESRQRAEVATLLHQIPLSPDGPSRFLVRFDFPGVVSVYEHCSGALIVRSMPGHPAVPVVIHKGHAS